MLLHHAANVVDRPAVLVKQLTAHDQPIGTDRAAGLLRHRLHDRAENRQFLFSEMVVDVRGHLFQRVFELLGVCTFAFEQLQQRRRTLRVLLVTMLDFVFPDLGGGPLERAVHRPFFGF